MPVVYLLGYENLYLCSILLVSIKNQGFWIFLYSFLDMKKKHKPLEALKTIQLLNGEKSFIFGQKMIWINYSS